MPDALFPVYVLAKDCGEVKAYQSLGAMQGYMEAIDVENDEYEAWDATGRLIQLSVGSSKSQWLQIVTKDERASNENFAAITAKAVPSRQRAKN